MLANAAGISYIRNNEVVIYKRPKPAKREAYIETDSYIAVQLIEQQGSLDFDSLKSMAETVQGNFTFTFTVLDQNNNLYIIKGSNPMCLLNFPALGLYVYASTESIVNNALKRVGLHKFAYEKIETAEGDILRIDRNGVIERSEFEPALYRSKFGAWYDTDDSPFYSLHEELLLTYCGCYGVDTSEVELLLDYGYTCDEIEEMLNDHDLLQEALGNVRFMCGEDIYESYNGVF